MMFKNYLLISPLESVVIDSELSDGVIGNTSDFGSEESRFDSWSDSTTELQEIVALLV